MQRHIIEYEIDGSQWRTTIEAVDIESAKAQFNRDFPNADLLACYPETKLPVAK